jgi:endonuclease/exonuclease/phosphatase family metal-dependent hydrolase
MPIHDFAMPSGMVKKIIAATTLSLAATLTMATTTHAAQAAEATQASKASSGSVDVRVASFNAQSVSLDETSGEVRPWAQRRPVVIADILREKLDVVGLQELNPSRFFRSRLTYGPTQFLDLKQGLNRAGGAYRLANQKSYNCVNATTSYKCHHKYRGASNSDRILYNTQTVQLVHQGSVKYKAQSPRSTNPRYLAWAVLRMRATGSEFLFTTTHLDPTDLSTRKAEWRELITKVKQLKGSRPVISVGDFNTQKNNTWAKQFLPKMKNAGFGDVLNQQYHVNPIANPRAQSTINGWINSYNHEKRDVASYGYEDARNKTGNGIDWIFASNSLKVKQWEVVLDYNPHTLQVEGTLPSDHNMVRATIRLP